MTNLDNAFDNLSTDILGLLTVTKAKDLRALIRGALERKAGSDGPVEVPPTVLSRPVKASESEMQVEIDRIKAIESARVQSIPREPMSQVDDSPTDVLPTPEAIPTPLPSGDGFVITHGTRDGYVEIRFDSKPDGEVRKVLKTAKFKFTKSVYIDGKKVKGQSDPRWYGKAANLPEMFKSALRRAA